MSTVWLVILVIASSIVALVLWALMLAIIRERALANLPPRPPLRCPKCNSEHVDEIESGIACSGTHDGAHHCHSYEYGICKQCGTPFQRCDSEQASILSDEVWTIVRNRNETARKRLEAWPFPSE